MIRALVIFLVAFIALPSWAETPILSAKDAFAGMRSGALVVLDIRSPEEWAESGVAEGAWPVSMHRPDFGAQLQAILAQYAPEQIALICATGGRSNYIATVLAENGITGVADVSEGMFGNPRGPGWLARGMPVLTPEEAQTAYRAALSQ